MSMGDDPHFSIVLPSGKLLCFSVMGDHGSSYSLISNRLLQMNAIFSPDSQREEVTWIGTLGMVIPGAQGMKKTNATKLVFEATKQEIRVGDKVTLQAKNIERMTVRNGKLSLSEAVPVEGFRYPQVLVSLEDSGLSFTIVFKNEHLDMFWHSAGQQNEESHGLIGEFCTQFQGF